MKKKLSNQKNQKHQKRYDLEITRKLIFKISKIQLSQQVKIKGKSFFFLSSSQFSFTQICTNKTNEILVLQLIYLQQVAFILSSSRLQKECNESPKDYFLTLNYMKNIKARRQIYGRWLMVVGYHRYLGSSNRCFSFQYSLFLSEIESLCVRPEFREQMPDLMWLEIINNICSFSKIIQTDLKYLLILI